MKSNYLMRMCILIFSSLLNHLRIAILLSNKHAHRSVQINYWCTRNYNQSRTSLSSARLNRTHPRKNHLVITDTYQISILLNRISILLISVGTGKINYLMEHIQVYLYPLFFNSSQFFIQKELKSLFISILLH